MTEEIAVVDDEDTSKNAEVTQNDKVVEEPPSEDEAEESACGLIHPAGFGVVDTGCGRGVVGSETLRRHEIELNKHGLMVEELESRPHVFRYGNGSSDTSHRRVQLPVFIRGRELRMRLHVVPGNVPLLVSKRFLKGLGSRLELDGNEIYLGKAGVAAEMVERPDGSYQINLIDVQATPICCRHPRSMFDGGGDESTESDGEEDPWGPTAS